MTSRSTDRGDNVERRILTLAAEIAETTDRNVPSLLLKLDDMLKSADADSHDAAKIRQAIFEYDLFQVLILVLKQDFTRVTGSWETAARLALLLSDCCLDVRDDTDEGTRSSLPDALENQLALARRLQEKYCLAHDSKGSYFSKDDILNCMKDVLKAVKQLVQFHITLNKNAMESASLLQLLITDDAQTALITIGLISRLIRLDNAVLGAVEAQSLHRLLDEIVYKLAISSNAEVARSAIRLILLIMETHPPCVEMVCQRYKGLRLLVTKWSGQGFGRELKTLLMLLDAGTATRADLVKYDHAARVIQTNWRGYNTRLKLRRADHTFKKFHRSFRQKQEEKVVREGDQRIRSELEHQLLMARKKSMRELKERQLKILEVLPAGAVAQYMKQEQHDYARRIQAQWRGYRARTGLNERRRLHRLDQAARTIQRAAVRWIERVKSKRWQSALTEWPIGLTDERREEIEAQIRKYREERPYKNLSRAEQEELHEKAQAMLLRYSIDARTNMRAYQYRRALLAQVDTDCDLITNAPKLSEVTEEDLDNFVSRSRPIVVKAHQLHNERMKRLRQPWWMAKLTEFDDGHGDDTTRRDYVKLA